MRHLLLIVVLIVSMLGISGTLQVQTARAACGVGPQPMTYSSGWRGKGGISGCGTSATIQVCAQSSDGTVWGCRTWTGNTNNGVVYVTSLAVSSAHGCLVRSWVWSPYWGTQVSYWTNIC